MYDEKYPNQTYESYSDLWRKWTNYSKLQCFDNSPKVQTSYTTHSHLYHTRQYLTCSNYGKTSHVKETCHNKKKEKPTIRVVPNNVAVPMAKVTAQLVKPTIVPLRYLCIIYYSSKHCALDCPIKAKVQNML